MPQGLLQIRAYRVGMGCLMGEFRSPNLKPGKKSLKKYSLFINFQKILKKSSPEILFLIKKWTESTDDVHQRALLALRFVQR